ncbi:MAG: MFS transporter, partial [Chloroflexota bacterium]|nr:MFS transporter [Chloroflexota bacterium]
MSWTSGVSRDGWLLFFTCGLRTFGFGFVSVMLGLYLALEGLSAPAIGGIFAAALAGGAVTTIAAASVADRFGRRRILMIGAVAMAGAG